MNYKFISIVEEKFGSEHIFSRKELLNFCENHELSYPTWLVKNYKVSRGSYKVPSSNKVFPLNTSNMIEVDSHANIPKKDSGFIPFGFASDLKKIINSNIFYPIYISGESGSGKTYCVEQVCASLGRECIRVNFSVETDQNDLLGSPTLIDGNIKYNDGPVLTAMRNGSILLLDEIDRCHAGNALILNGILEGNSHYNPKTGETIYPKEGFNIIATANTKGNGSEDGKYLSQILDASFVERFAITWEQNYPESKIEIKILSNYLKEEDFISDLVKWAQIIRQTYDQGGVGEVISTRRLVHIAKTFNIFKDREKAIRLCVSRFDSETKNSFIDLYNKIVSPTEETLKEDVSDNLSF